MQDPKGLLVHVYTCRAFRDSSNRGVSSLHSSFVLVGPGIDGPFEPDDETPALLLKGRGDHVYAVPLTFDEETGEWSELRQPGMLGPMAGGNFVYTCDSRGLEYPIAVHDRFETQAEYDALSR